MEKRQKHWSVHKQVSFGLLWTFHWLLASYLMIRCTNLHFSVQKTSPTLSKQKGWRCRKVFINTFYCKNWKKLKEKRGKTSDTTIGKLVVRAIDALSLFLFLSRRTYLVFIKIKSFKIRYSSFLQVLFEAGPWISELSRLLFTAF